MIYCKRQHSVIDCYERKVSNLGYTLTTDGSTVQGVIPSLYRSGELGRGPDHDQGMTITTTFPDNHNKLVVGRCKRIRFTLTSSGRVFDHIIVRNLDHSAGHHVTWCGLYMTRVGQNFPCLNPKHRAWRHCHHDTQSWCSYRDSNKYSMCLV